MGTISATYNWWGASSGPYHGTSNPTGLGDKVSDWVEYKPYLIGTYTGPSISVAPQSGNVSDPITVEGIIFESNKEISLSFGTHQTITTTTSSNNGTFSATFKISVQFPSTKVITATDSEGNLATTLFYIIPSEILVSPSSALAGKEITVQGSSFVGNTQISISFGTFSTITTTKSNTNGTFSTTFLVPAQTPGTKIITATDSEGNLATTTFLLLPPTFLKILPAYNLIAKGQEFDVEVTSFFSPQPS
ncbi:hypothetical protein HY793_03320 [Candidatus Desantisbacteria bacterium]|nr:hypothetical protein [Candidatus Desantisbacteria bacterium]